MAEINLANIPIQALNVSSRLRLSWFLNPEQPLPSKNSVARDYRGLAEQLDFLYNDIKNFQRSDDPTSKILEALETNSDVTIGDLVKFLENMGRYDALNDLLPRFENDAKAFLRKRKGSKEISPYLQKQLSEVSHSSYDVSYPVKDHPDVLTLGDALTGELTYYDAYICYADKNRDFVDELMQILESPEIGYRLFIRERDLLAGKSEHCSHAQLIQDRCNRMLIVLSPDFLKSPECEFQASFAAGLAIEQRERKLIPVVIEQCEIPLILKFISKVDFTKPGNRDWVWGKLITSIRPVPLPMFVFPNGNFFSKKRCQIEFKCTQLPQIESQKFAQLPAIESHDQSCGDPLITFPSTSSNLSICSVDTSSALDTAACSTVRTTTAVAVPEMSLNDSSSGAAKATPKLKWFHNLRRFVPHSNNSFSNVSTSVSNATSGFHSQSDDIESLDSISARFSNGMKL